MQQLAFRTFIDDQLSKGFDEFVTLYSPGPTKPWEYANQWELMRASLRDTLEARIARLRRFGRAQEYQERWLAEVRKKVEGNFRYLMVIEDRVSKRDFMFHILLGGCDWGQYEFGDWWAPRWKEISGGIAFKRLIDERIGGLLWYFVNKKRLTLETDNGQRYDASEFEEWNRY